MAWQKFRVTYELVSPLHIGYHKIGNLQRTRYYIPARNVWGAVTEALTRRGFSAPDAPTGDYQKIGEWAQKHCALGYWFVREKDEPLTPGYTDAGLKYGGLTAFEFERRYLASHVTTALDAATTSAEEGSLHEVEFIAPYTREGARTQIGGWVFLDETAQTKLQWNEWLGNLQIGGERRYGFGQLRLSEFTGANEPRWELAGKRPAIELREGEPLCAHAIANGIRVKGMIEPLVGRETRTDSQRFGMTLTRRVQICWAPGAIVQQDATFEVTEMGTWRHVP